MHEFSRLAPVAGGGHLPGMKKILLRAVLYREDGLWVAHALEMDLIGTGATEAAALRELRSNAEAQLSFAKQERMNPFRPAPPEIQNLWNETNLAALGITKTRPKAEQRSTRVLEWSDSQVSRIKGNLFQCA
jgi:hypothetical protein